MNMNHHLRTSNDSILQRSLTAVLDLTIQLYAQTLEKFIYVWLCGTNWFCNYLTLKLTVMEPSDLHLIIGLSYYHPIGLFQPFNYNWHDRHCWFTVTMVPRLSPSPESNDSRTYCATWTISSINITVVTYYDNPFPVLQQHQGIDVGGRSMSVKWQWCSSVLHSGHSLWDAAASPSSRSSFCFPFCLDSNYVKCGLIFLFWKRKLSAARKGHI